MSERKIMEQKCCYTCEKDLTPENTASYGGFDAGNYNLANTFGRMEKDVFIKCDPCFDADIDNYLENLYN
jgi:hypothetical protein